MIALLQSCNHRRSRRSSSSSNSGGWFRFGRMHRTMTRYASCVTLAFGATFVVAMHQVSLMSGNALNGELYSEQGKPGRSSFDDGPTFLPSIPGNVLLFLGWSRWRESYNWDLSTEDNYRSSEPRFHGKYANIRATLDYTYHSYYTEHRQLLQDAIIDSMLQRTKVIDQNGEKCVSPTQPWLVLTAGAMGAGKSYTVRRLAQKGHFPLDSFVTVDADQVRHHLPEFAIYIQKDAERAGEYTRKEAGYIVEILTEVALRQGQNVLLDGTLKDASWYQTYLDNLRRAHPTLRTCILHVTAPREAIIQRAKSRATATGRVVPREVLENAILQVPKSVEQLRSRVDVALELYNAPHLDDVQIKNEGVDWEAFRNTWKQKCAH